MTITKILSKHIYLSPNQILNYMMHLNRSLLAVLVFIMVSCSGRKELSQWRGPDRDGKYPQTGLLKQWPDGAMRNGLICWAGLFSMRNVCSARLSIKRSFFVLMPGRVISSMFRTRCPVERLFLLKDSFIVTELTEFWPWLRQMRPVAG